MPVNNQKNSVNGVSKKRQRTAERIIKAIKESNGFLTEAAPKAGVGYRTIVRYANEYPSVREAVEEAKEGMTDFVESQLFKAIKEGNIAAIIFYLKTQAKDRNYTERINTEHSGEIKTVIKVRYDEEVKSDIEVEKEREEGD